MWRVMILHMKEIFQIFGVFVNPGLNACNLFKNRAYENWLFESKRHLANCWKQTGRGPAAAPQGVEQHSLRPPTVEEESQSDSGSLASATDLDGKKSGKKKRSFFNFRRKKEKIPWRQFGFNLLKKRTCHLMATIDEKTDETLPLVVIPIS